MVESLKKLREVSAFVVLGVLALNLLLGVIGVIITGADLGIGLAASAYANVSTMGLPLVLLTALVASCVLIEERTKNARLLTLLSLVVIGIGLLIAFVTSVIGLVSGSVVGFLTTLVSFAIPVLAVLFLWRLFQGQPAPVRQVAPQALPPNQGGYPYPQQPQPPQQMPAPQYGHQQPTWQPDQASGAAWHTADQAASGASASGWGAPGEVGGWQPVQPHQPIHPTQPVQPSQPVQSSSAYEHAEDLTRIAPAQMEEFRRQDEQRQESQESRVAPEPQAEEPGNDWWNRQT